MINKQEIKMKALISKSGKVFYFNGKDLHCHLGCVKKSDIENAKPGSIVKTNKGFELYVIDAGFYDLYSKIKRMPQIVPKKDVGIIIAETGIGKNSRIVEAGSGSGAVLLALANISKKVYSYELRKDFYNLVKENIKLLGLKNITIKNKDIYSGIDEKGIDLVFLDLPEPWKAIKPAEKCLKPGGFIVAYSPCIPQVSDFCNSINESKCFIFLKAVEIIEREWEIEKRKIRPKSRQLGHSGFLCFARKAFGYNTAASR